MIPTIGDEMKAILRARRLSQAKAADRVDCDHSYISRIVAGVRSPSPEFIERFSERLALSDEEYIRLNIVAGYLPLGIRPLILELIAKGAA